MTRSSTLGSLLDARVLNQQTLRSSFYWEASWKKVSGARIVDWWEPTAEAARAAGLEVLAPRFVSIDDLSTREYRSLDLLHAEELSPAD
jgi:hypothetical protein